MCVHVYVALYHDGSMQTTFLYMCSTLLTRATHTLASLFPLSLFPLSLFPLSLFPLSTCLYMSLGVNPVLLTLTMLRTLDLRDNPIVKVRLISYVIMVYMICYGQPHREGASHSNSILSN